MIVDWRSSSNASSTCQADHADEGEEHQQEEDQEDRGKGTENSGSSDEEMGALFGRLQREAGGAEDDQSRDGGHLREGTEVEKNMGEDSSDEEMGALFAAERMADEAARSMAESPSRTSSGGRPAHLLTVSPQNWQTFSCFAPPKRWSLERSTLRILFGDRKGKRISTRKRRTTSHRRHPARTSSRW